MSNSPSKHPNAWLGQYGSGYHWSADPAFLAATAIAETSFESGGNTYDGLSLLKAWIANIDAAIDAVTANGDTPDIKAIIWHQGDNLHFDAAGAELFGKRLYNRMIDESVITGERLDVKYAQVDYSD